MPRVIVITDQTEPDDAQLLFDERVNPGHLSTDHAAMQFIERLGWAISDADEAEQAKVRRPTPRVASARRLGSHHGWIQARSPLAFGRSQAGSDGALAETYVNPCE